MQKKKKLKIFLRKNIDEFKLRIVPNKDKGFQNKLPCQRRLREKIRHRSWINVNFYFLKQNLLEKLSPQLIERDPYFQ